MIAASALLACAAFGGCGGGDDPEVPAPRAGQITVTETTFPDSLDPQRARSREALQALWRVHVPLLTYRRASGGAGTKLVAGLAEDLPEVSEDGLSYTLQLRQGMRYSDGTRIRAGDLVVALERAVRAPDGPGALARIQGVRLYLAGGSSVISGVSADDASGRIVIRLLRPSGSFPNELASLRLAPVPPRRSGSPALSPASGPYMLTSVDRPSGFVLVPNPRFESVRAAGLDVPAASVDEVRVRTQPSVARQLEAIERGRADLMVDPVPPDRAARIESRFPGRVRDDPTLEVFYFWLNTRSPPFNDLRVRQAVNRALDRELIVAGFGGAQPMQQILPAGVPGHRGYRLFQGADLEGARSLLAEASPRDTEVVVWTDAGRRDRRVAAFYRRLLVQLGFRARLRVVPPSRYRRRIGDLRTPSLDTGLASWVPSSPHPAAFFGPLLDGAAITARGNTNLSRVDIPELNEEIERLDRRQLGDAGGYAELDRKFMEQAVWVPWGQGVRTTLASRRIDLDDLVVHPVFGYDYAGLGLDARREGR